MFFDQPASDFERLQRAQAAGTVSIAEGNLATLQLVRPDGSFYEEKGTLDFSDYAVNPVTGAVAFRGRIANPQRTLLPGMFVNVRLTAGVLNKGFEVPQLAVQRDGQGPYALVVGADGKVLQKRVETIAVVGNNWVIGSGLDEGDQVVVSGIPKAQPGTVVKAVPADASANAAAPGAPAVGS